MDNKIFLDTDVILDVLVGREPFFENSYAIFLMAEKKEVELFTSVSVILNVQYVGAKYIGAKKTIDAINFFIDQFEICDADKNVLKKAYSSRAKDVEDAVQYFSALKTFELSYFITRNIGDYKSFEEKSLAVVTPTQFLKRIK